MATGNMVTPRGFHTTTPLLNGKILVAGGVNASSPFPPGFPALAEAELYDPATGTWSATGSMTTPRFGNTLNLLFNGRVLAAGGEDKDVSVLQSSETYEPGHRRVDSRPRYDHAQGERDGHAPSEWPRTGGQRVPDQ
jgi:hypothetical protein